MSIVRRFRVAPSLMRLIRKERGGARVTEGYFAPQSGRTSFVRIDGQDCHLVLVTADAAGRSQEERTEVPRAHGDALLDVCAGKAVYERTTLALGGGREAVLDRYVTPAGLDLASVAFDDEAAAKTFAPPAWFGADVSAEADYERHAVAIKGVPASGEVALSNAALDAVLDLIEPRFGFGSALRRPLGAETALPAAEKPAVPPKPAAAAPAPAAAAQRIVPERPPEKPPAPRPAAATPPAPPRPPRPPAPPPVAEARPPEPPLAAAAPPKVPEVKSPEAPPVAAPPASPKLPEMPAAPPLAAQAKPPEPPKPAAVAPPEPRPAPPAAVPPAPARPPEARPVPPPAAEVKPPQPAAASLAAASLAANAEAGAAPEEKADSRIDDVIESLSQALSAAIQQPREPAQDDDLGASFERWTVRPRRTNQQN